MRSLSGSSPLERLGIGVGRLLGLMALAAKAGAAVAMTRTATATAATILRVGAEGTKPILPPNPHRHGPLPARRPDVTVGRVRGRRRAAKLRPWSTRDSAGPASRSPASASAP